MKTKLICLLIVTGFAMPAYSALTLAEGWIRVQQALMQGDPEELNERIRELQVSATEVEARRLTPYSMALVKWAEENPGPAARMVVARAQELDPLLPSPHFLMARLEWRDGSKLRSLRYYFSGWVRLFTYEGSRSVLFRSAVLWVLFSGAFAISVVMLLQTVRFFRVLVHDVRELGRVLFKAVNATVFTIVMLTLPIFGGLGPIWVLVYLFALTWIYANRAQRAIAIVLCVLMILLVPMLEFWQEAGLQGEPLTRRLVRMLESRMIDPGSLREFAELESTLGASGEYHMLLAEVLRLHGDSENARLQFQKAALVDSADARPQVALGNLAVEDGNLNRGIQHYDAAIAIDSQSILAYFNLSFAYDQSYRFQDADAARARARELGGGNPEETGVRGRAPRIRFPGLGRENVEKLLNDIPPATRLAAGLGSIRLRPLRWFAFPLPIIFIFCIVFGLAILIVRKKWMWKATACIRCGKVFCPRCQTSSESTGYCAQCVSVFLKRDLVSIEQQSAKMSQIRRWDFMRSTIEKIASVVLPGGSLVLRGKMVQGLLVGLGAWLCLLGALFWLPRFVPSAESQVYILPVQILLLIGFALFWMRSITVGWSRR